MTNWIGTQTDRFCSLVSHAGLASLSAFYGVTDVPAWWNYMFGTTIYERPQNYDTFSPICHIANWKTPTLVIHGQMDYRVPIGEGLLLFEALESHGIDCEFLVFPDENHWILKPKNVVVWYETFLDFIAQRLP